MEKLADRFILEREVGSGGMSTVYLGRDEVLGRPVAVKVLKSGFADTDIGDRFQREGRTAASLSHPSIVPVYDAGEGEVGGREVSYIVMEHVSGGDLKDLLDKRGPLGAKELSRIGREVAAGLAHAHGRGIVHRDIKPHNILLDGSGRPKLTDFGIARALEATRMTQTGSYLGTALYSSPEQLRGEDITTKSDVYSLGATLYQAAAGAAPFQGSPMEVAEKHISKDPKPPGELNPRVDENLAALILACLAKNPDERPTANEVETRLTAIPEPKSPDESAAGAAAPSRPGGTNRGERGDRGSSSAGASPAGSSARKRGWRGVLVALAVVAMLAVVVGLVAAPSLLGGGAEESASQNEAPQNEEAASPGDSAEGGQPEEADSPVEPDAGGAESAPVEPDESNPLEPDTGGAEVDEPSPVDPDGGGDEVDGSETDGSSSTGSDADSSSSDSSGSGGLSEGAAADVVEGFYTTAADGDYASSDEFLSTGYRATFPDEATFEGTFATLESISFVEEPDVEVSGTTATVTGTTEAVHADRTELNTATWTVVDEGGEWKLDNITIQDTRVV